MELSQIFERLRYGAEKLARLDASQKNAGLLAAASSIDKNRKKILDANEIDVKIDNLYEEIKEFRANYID